MAPGMGGYNMGGYGYNMPYGGYNMPTAPFYQMHPSYGAYPQYGAQPSVGGGFQQAGGYGTPQPHGAAGASGKYGGGAYGARLSLGPACLPSVSDCSAATGTPAVVAAKGCKIVTCTAGHPMLLLKCISVQCAGPVPFSSAAF